MTIKIPNKDGTGYSIQVACFPWSEKIGLIFGDWEHTVEIDRREVKLLKVALDEYIDRLDVLGSETYEPPGLVGTD